MISKIKNESKKENESKINNLKQCITDAKTPNQMVHVLTGVKSLWES